MLETNQSHAKNCANAKSEVSTMAFFWMIYKLILLMDCVLFIGFLCDYYL